MRHFNLNYDYNNSWYSILYLYIQIKNNNNKIIPYFPRLYMYLFGTQCFIVNNKNVKGLYKIFSTLTNDFQAIVK